MITALGKKESLLVVAATLALLVFAAAAWLVAGATAALLTLPVACAAAVIAVVLDSHRRMTEESRKYRREANTRRDQDYRQVEALLSVFFTIRPIRPLPETRLWAASPDLLKRIIDIVLREKPRVVLEASSGVSTVVIGYCLRQLGAGRVVSLEHDEKYATATRRLVEAHGLDDVATVLHSPLTPTEIDGRSWLWYDTRQLGGVDAVDVFVIDGPPADTQELARYPALPIIYPRLREGGVVLMDDGQRRDEKVIVARWQQEFPGLDAEYLELEKGAFLLHKKPGAGFRAMAGAGTAHSTAS
jgi:predicted O-methyltransferase YrrM